MTAIAQPAADRRWIDQALAWYWQLFAALAFLVVLASILANTPCSASSRAR